MGECLNPTYASHYRQVSRRHSYNASRLVPNIQGWYFGGKVAARLAANVMAASAGCAPWWPGWFAVSGVHVFSPSIPIAKACFVPA